MPVEEQFDTVFTARLALREKQIQQSYRPTIGIHKWFARRPGTLFRSLLLAEFDDTRPLRDSFWLGHDLAGVVADPFMGGGTTLVEANRLGLHVVGSDVNPMAYWVVRQTLDSIDLNKFTQEAAQVSEETESEIGWLYETACTMCHESVPVKYFMWVKQQDCPHCNHTNDLFPGYMLAENVRHPRYVFACPECQALIELAEAPTEASPAKCSECGSRFRGQGPARKGHIKCRSCTQDFRYGNGLDAPPQHRMWAIEYYCETCRTSHRGRFFKSPDVQDVSLVDKASRLLAASESRLLLPIDAIPPGDETARLHRWGYSRYRDMFGPRQLLGLGLLLGRLTKITEMETRYALLTVFSDFLRYQNMLCRYDTYALKCQDIFSVHGYPVGLVQCENNLLGIPRIGSGSFRHFVEKYKKAKQFCIEPFEVRAGNGRKEVVVIPGESVEADFVDNLPAGDVRQAMLVSGPADSVSLPEASLDGVFTDPPYFDNVQYAELMDFCFVWLKQALPEIPGFRASTTRSQEELTGNATEGRGLSHFAEGLSRVFQHYAHALKPGAPFVFTYHRNDLVAYGPLIVAILDAGLITTEALVAPAEMGASLHIAGTGSSIIDTVFVCRRSGVSRDLEIRAGLVADVLRDSGALAMAGVKVSAGDVRCVSLGRIAHAAVHELRDAWDSTGDFTAKIRTSEEVLGRIAAEVDLEALVARTLETLRSDGPGQQVLDLTETADVQAV